jgi:energy-coupling factor transporter ATP-binding protein EcfA2
MFLLITGASGSGKSSARVRIAPALEPEVACVELRDVVPIPPAPTLAWRQEATEAVVRLALEHQAEGRHLLLSGDPVAPGEVLAAPSADQLDGVRACLLHADPAQQEARLRGRGEPPDLFPAHLGFAAWMHGHAADPSHMPEVLTTDGWEEMRWERWIDRRAGDPSWNVAEVDTSPLSLDQVAAAALDWARASLRGETPPLLVSAG